MEALRSYPVCAEVTGTTEDVACTGRYQSEKSLDGVWITLILGSAGFYRDESALRKLDVLTGLSSRPPTRLLEPPLYDELPPAYGDVIHDLPPEYSALPQLAKRKSTGASSAPKPREKSRRSSLKARMLGVHIDFENPTGVREHKKKKPAAKKAAPAPSPPPPPPPPAEESGGGDDNPDGDGAGGGGDSGGGGDGDGNGDGNGDGGDGDDWGAWNVSGKKKDKKKKEEEEEAEKLAKEEEERKAAEASAANNLDWAEDEGGDDSWTGFASAGKKKKGKVRISIPLVQHDI